MSDWEDRVDRERRRKKASDPPVNRLQEIGPIPEEFHRRPHGPRVGRVYVGQGLPVVPILLGVAALVVVVGYQTDIFSRLWHAITRPTASQSANVNDAAIKEAELAVPRFLKNQAVSIGNIWAVSPRLACGYVNEQTLPGQPESRRRFIFAAGSVRFDDGSAGFARDWSARCKGPGAPLAEIAEIEPKPIEHRNASTH